MERLLLRVSEAAVLLGIGRSKAYELVKAGQLPVVRIDRSVRIPLAALQTWVEQLPASEPTADQDPAPDRHPRAPDQRGRPAGSGQAQPARTSARMSASTRGRRH